MRQYSSSYIFNEQTPSGQPLLLGSLKRRKLGGSRTSQRVNNEPGVGASAGSAGATAGREPWLGSSHHHLVPLPVPTPTLHSPPPPGPTISAALPRSPKPLFSDPLLCLTSLSGGLASGRQPALRRHGASGHPVSLLRRAERSRLSGWVGMALYKGNPGKVGARVSSELPYRIHL